MRLLLWGHASCKTVAQRCVSSTEDAARPLEKGGRGCAVLAHNASILSEDPKRPSRRLRYRCRAAPSADVRSPPGYSDTQTLNNMERAGPMVPARSSMVSPFGPEEKGQPVQAATEVDRRGSHVNLQIGAWCNHREARTARITCGRCSRSTAVRITMSSITISA